MNDPEQLNAIINTVARRMTDRAAPDMRARVMARLAVRRPARPWLVPGGALAAAACAALVFVVSRPQVQPSPVTLTSEFVASPTESGGPSGPSQTLSRTADIRSPGPLGPGSRADLKVRPSGSPPPAPSADQLAWQAASVPMLDRLELLTLESIQPVLLEVRPLTMAPLEVPAIGAEDE